MSRTKDSFKHQHTNIKYNKHVRKLLEKKMLKKDDLSYVQDVLGYGRIRPKKEEELEDKT